MKKISLLILGASLAANMASAANTITASSDSANPALWSAASNWDDSTPVNSLTVNARMTLASGETVGYINVDGDYSALTLSAQTAGAYNIDIADGKLLTIASTGNSLFFHSSNTTLANININSGALKSNVSAAIYLNKSGQSVTFASGTTFTEGGDLKVRASSEADATKFVRFAGTTSAGGGFEVYGNVNSGSTTAGYVDGSVSALRLLVSGFGVPATLNSNVGTALEVVGNITLIGSATDTQNYIQAYGTGADSDATVVVKNGGSIAFTNGSSSIGVKMAADANSATALQIDQGGSFSAKTLNVTGNTFNSDKAAIVANGALTASSLNIKAESLARVDINATGSLTAGSVYIGTDATTADMNATLNIAGGTNNVSGSVIVGRDAAAYSSNLSLTGGSTSVNNLRVNGGSSVSIGGDAVLTAATGVWISNLSNVVVGENAKLNITSGGISIAWVGESTSPSQLTINSANNSITGNIHLIECAKMTVGATNTWNSDFLVRGGRTALNVTAGKLTLNSILVVSDLQKSINLNVSSGAQLIFGSFMGEVVVTGNDTHNTFIGFGQQTVGSTLNIVDFLENTILFKTIGTESENQAFLDAIRLDGAVSEDLRFSEYDAAAGGYWLTTVAVPEPAEFAAIFGALAIALAVYRRRK